MPTPRLVVFDWDRTLIDSIGSIVECTFAMLDELELPRLDQDKVLGLIGSSMSSSIDSLAPGADEEIRTRILETYRRLWFEQYRHRSTLIDGAVETLEQLASRESFLAVATAKSRRGLDVDLERTGLGRFFQHSRTAEETAPKPQPAMLFALMGASGVEAEETVMVGDTEHDLEMARRARVTALAVATGAVSRRRLEAQAPEACFESLEEIVPWLDRRAAVAIPVERRP